MLYVSKNEQKIGNLKFHLLFPICAHWISCSKNKTQHRNTKSCFAILITILLTVNSSIFFVGFYLSGALGCVLIYVGEIDGASQMT